MRNKYIIISFLIFILIVTSIIVLSLIIDNGSQPKEQPRYPMNYIKVTVGYSSDHLGIDFGGKDTGIEPIYAIADGVVISKGIDSVGNYFVIIKHDNLIKDKRVISRYFHFSSFSESYVEGSKVSKGQLLGIEGKTGDAEGNHLHFELWVCPLDYKYNVSDKSKYSVMPLDYLYLFEDQIIMDDSLFKSYIKKNSR